MTGSTLVFESAETEEAYTAFIRLSPEELYQQIAELAYNLYLERGCQEGHDLDDWLEAERRVLYKRV